MPLLLAAPPQLPSSTLVIGIIFGVPLICAAVAFEAAYSPLPISAAYLLPLGAILALLFTPIMSDDGEAEPAEGEVATRYAEAYEDEHAKAYEDVIAEELTLAVTDKRLKGAITTANALTQRAELLVDQVESVRGMAEEYLAKSLQLFMGAAALFQIWVLFVDTPATVVAALLSLVCTSLQLPDAFGWVIVEAKRVPCVETLNEDLNARRVGLEQRLHVAAEEMMRRYSTSLVGAAGVRSQLQSIRANVQASILLSSSQLTTSFSSSPLVHSAGDTMSPVEALCACVSSSSASLLAACRSRLLPLINEVGYRARQSPLKVLVAILNLVVALDGVSFSLPTLPTLPSLPTLATFESIAAGVRPLEVVHQWAINLTSSSDFAYEAQGALGPVRGGRFTEENGDDLSGDVARGGIKGEASNCLVGPTDAWIPMSTYEAAHGIELLFPLPVHATDVVVHYQRAGVRALSAAVDALSSDPSSSRSSSSSILVPVWVNIGMVELQGGRGEIHSWASALVPESLDGCGRLKIALPDQTITQKLRVTLSIDGAVAASAAGPDAKGASIEGAGGDELDSEWILLGGIGVDGVLLEGLLASDPSTLESVAEEEEEEEEEKEEEEEEEEEEGKRSKGKEEGKGRGGGTGDSPHPPEPPPLGAAAAAVSCVATAVATSDLVRKHVRPSEYADGAALERARRDRARRRREAEARLRAAVSPRLLDVDVDETSMAIEEAESAAVAVALIAHARQVMQEASDAQQAARRRRDLAEAALARAMAGLSAPPLVLALAVDVAALEACLHEATVAGVRSDLLEAAAAMLVSAIRAQEKRARAEKRLRAAASSEMDPPPPRPPGGDDEDEDGGAVSSALGAGGGGGGGAGGISAEVQAETEAETEAAAAGDDVGAGDAGDLGGNLGDLGGNLGDLGGNLGDLGGNLGDLVYAQQNPLGDLPNMISAGSIGDLADAVRAARPPVLGEQLRIDLEELNAALAEATEAMVEESLLMEMRELLEQAMAAQRGLTLGVGTFVSRLRSRAAERRRRAAAEQHLASAHAQAHAALGLLVRTRRAERLLTSIEELESALVSASRARLGGAATYPAQVLHAERPC
jgi:hypothetical protein